MKKMLKHVLVSEVRHVNKLAGDIDEFIKKSTRGGYVERALRFTVDSIVGEYLRVLVANLARPVEKHLGLAGLAQLGVWGEEKEKVVTREEAAAMIGVKSSLLLERRVFIRMQERSFDITEQVRMESKKAYKPLLSREIIPSKGKLEEFR